MLKSRRGKSARPAPPTGGYGGRTGPSFKKRFSKQRQVLCSRSLSFLKTVQRKASYCIVASNNINDLARVGLKTADSIPHLAGGLRRRLWCWLGRGGI
jgi:hypothetical protein